MPSNYKSKFAVCLAIIGVVLIVTNPTPTDFNGYLSTKSSSTNGHGRTGYFLFFSIYSVTYWVDNGLRDRDGSTIYSKSPVSYFGIFKNFIQISNWATTG